MLVGAADIFANQPFLVIGSAGTPNLDDVDWADESAVWNNGEHLLVATFGNAGLVRVTVWESAMPLVGEIVFDGQLELSNSQLSVADPEELTRLTMRVGEAGPQRIVVCADDPGYASRISIGFDLGEQVTELTSVAAHLLPTVLVSATGELSWSAELGLILDGHDVPLARLAAAIKLMPMPGSAASDDDAAEPDISRLVEWFRGLGPSITLSRAEDCGAEIANRLRATSPQVTGLVDEIALSIATDALRTLELG